MFICGLRLMWSLSPGDRRAFQHKTSGSGEAEAIIVLSKTSSNILTLTGFTWHETQANNIIHTAKIHSHLPQSVLFEISECRPKADVAWVLAEQLYQQPRQDHPLPCVNMSAMNRTGIFCVQLWIFCNDDNDSWPHISTQTTHGQL